MTPSDVTFETFALGRRPKGLRRRKLGACFRNAALVATDPRYPDLTYVEGAAGFPGEGQVQAALPPGYVHHAWLVDGDGYAVEVTWPPLPEVALSKLHYCGRRFTHDEVLAGLLSGVGAPLLTDEEIGALAQHVEETAR